MALHFSSEAPEDQFYTDFGNLNKFEDEVISINSILEAKNDLFTPLQAFQKLMVLVFEFLAAPQTVREIDCVLMIDSMIPSNTLIPCLKFLVSS